MARGKTSTRTTPTPAQARRLVDLGACIDFLENSGNLVRVRSEVDSRFELAAVAKRFEGGKAVLFERVKQRNVELPDNSQQGRADHFIDRQVRAIAGEDCPSPLHYRTWPGALARQLRATWRRSDIVAQVSGVVAS